MQLYNLTYPQKNIWLMEKYNGNTPLNYILGVVEIKMDLITRSVMTQLMML